MCGRERENISSSGKEDSGYLLSALLLTFTGYIIRITLRRWQTYNFFTVNKEGRSIFSFAVQKTAFTVLPNGLYDV